MVYYNIFKTISTSIKHTWEQRYKKMAAQLNARWAFNVKTWTPTADQILSASSYIQNDEKERISKFVFQDDAKSALVGRLMLRKFVHDATGMPYNEIILLRDSYGKPVLAGSENKSPYFNISHQGDYVVLAGNNVHRIGIDIMKIEPPPNKNISEFFKLMTRQLSEKEWQTIRSYPTELEQMKSFYRHWCLKESYVKNIGVGITVKLSDISFTVQTPDLKVGDCVTNTLLYECNVNKNNFMFEETLLDEKHAVAVAAELKEGSDWDSVEYMFLSFDDIVSGAVSLHEPDIIFKDTFFQKRTKYF